MRILIASDKFKGSLTASEACAAILQGLETAPETSGAAFDVIPIADGGDGMARSITEAKEGDWIEIDADDALGRPVSAGYGWIAAESLAVIEMAEASGLWRLNEEEEDRDPWRASTFGTGQMIRHAIEQKGAGRILLGIGGSATNDGGTGMARALGFRFLDADGREMTDLPADLGSVARIDRDAALSIPPVTVACDVTNPLLGENGCTRIYGPQKGILSADISGHEARLEHLVKLCGGSGAGTANIPGAGAAGGLGFGCLVFLGAELRPGFDLVAETLGLEEAVRCCDLVITGEGRLDHQTLQGKAPAGVAGLARKHGKPAAAFAGVIDPDAEESLGAVFRLTAPIAPEAMATSEAMGRGAELLAAAAARKAGDLQALASPLGS